MFEHSNSSKAVYLQKSLKEADTHLLFFSNDFCFIKPYTLPEVLVQI